MKRGGKRRGGGNEDQMKHLCFGQEWLLYVVTVCLAAGFTIAGFMRLPLLVISESYHCGDW